MKRIHLLGLPNVLKPKIVLEMLLEMKAFNGKELEYLTCGEGFVTDYYKENNINIIKVKYDNINASIDVVKSRKANMLICLGWNKKLPTEFMNVYKCCINCHSGLLPDYRGNRAYMPLYANIPDHYGITIHYMNSEFDDGNIIKQVKLKLFLEETPLVIHRRMCEMIALTLPEAVRLAENGYKGEKQSGIARYFPALTREEMDMIRNLNIENIRNGLPKIVAPHKKWEI